MSGIIPLFPLSTPLFPGVVLPLRIFEPRYRRLVRDLLALPEGSPQRSFGVVAIRQGWEVEAVAPAEALYDVGCTARVQVVRPAPDGTFSVVTVGGDRFRLLDVLVAEDPPYLRAQVEWLADEEAAEDAAGDREGLVDGTTPAGAARAADDPAAADPAADPEAVAASVARGSMTVLVRTVRGLFARYVAEVAGLQEDGERPAGEAGPGVPDLSDPALDPALDSEVGELLRGVADDATALSWLVASVALLTTEDRQALLAESATRRRLATEARLLRRELTVLRALGAVPVPIAQFATPMTVN